MLETCSVDVYMTRNPVTVGADQPLAVAHRLMRRHGMRHLPVLAGGYVVGLVSERDLALVETMSGVDPERVRVEEAMTPDPYVVAPETGLARVCAHMAEHGQGSAVVVQGQHVVGIFTTTDALRALMHIVERTQSPGRTG
jgi:acetoin utilization protein AcuB